MPRCWECNERVFDDGCLCAADRPLCNEHLGTCPWCGPAIREQAAEELAGPNFGAVGF